jgi:hypothetical protein
MESFDKNRRMESFTDMSHVHGRAERFTVLENYSDKDEAKRYLEELNRRVIKLFAHLKRKYLRNRKACDPVQVKMVESLLSKYNPEIIEELKYNGEDTSYVVDKGKIFKLCLRDKNGHLVDFETMMFVFLHEISHVCQYWSYGHNRGFWRTFKFILINAHEAGIYEPVNYAKHPVYYVCMTVSYNGFFDDSIDVPRAGDKD